MPESTDDKPQDKSESPQHEQPETEPRSYLSATGSIPRYEDNYPEYGRQTDPVFPEEYALETESGLVREQTLDQIRSRTSITTARRRRPSQRDLEKAPVESTEFVTFKIDDPDHPQVRSILAL